MAVPGGPVPCPQQLSPDVLASEVFRWLHDEEVVDALYLQVRWVGSVHDNNVHTVWSFVAVAHAVCCSLCGL